MDCRFRKLCAAFSCSKTSQFKPNTFLSIETLSILTNFSTSATVTHFVFNGGLLVLVQMHFDQLRAVQLDADALSDNLSWEDKIVKNAVVDSGQGAATWALLLVWVGASALWLGQDLAFGAEHDVTSGEFLLQLTNQASLDLLESLLLGYWNVDNDGLK